MNAVEIKNLTKSFNNFTLGNISLNIPEGSVMGLIGENGSGKTTLIKLILDALHKDEGEISVLGFNQGDDSFYKIKDDIGVVTDSICFSQFFTSKEVDSVLSDLFTNWNSKTFFTYLEKFHVPLKTKIKDLSKGNKMKLSIASALSHKPRLLILDEPTGGLDPVAREDFLDMIWDFTRDEHHSVLISSHIVSDLEKICDYITFLHNGKILLSDEKDRILESCGILKCTEENFKDLDKSIVRGFRRSPYGMDVLIDRRGISSMETVKPSLEEIFVYMVKGEN